MKYGTTKTGKIHLFTDDNECICDLNIKLDKIVSNEYAEIVHSEKVCITCRVIHGTYEKPLADSERIIKRKGICLNCGFIAISVLTIEHDETRFVFTDYIDCPICAKRISMLSFQSKGFAQ